MVRTVDADVRRVHALVDREVTSAETCPLDALCAVALADLPALSATVCVQTNCGPLITAGSTRGVAGSLVDLEVVYGHGPVTDAAVLTRPVVLDDPAADPGRDWHGFTPRAFTMGVAAIWAIPVQVEGDPPVVLELSFSAAAKPAERHYRTAQTLATVAGQLITDDAVTRGQAVCLADLEALLATRAVVHQAQGMCMVRLDTDADGALAWIRAIATAREARLEDIAQDIVNRHLPIAPS